MNFRADAAGAFARACQLGDLLDFRNEIVHPRDRPVGSATFVGLEHIERGTGVRIGAERIDLSELTGRRARFYAGDIVYGYLRPYLNKVWIAEFDGICSVDQYVFVVRPEVDREYIARFLRSDQFLKTAPVDSTPGQLPRIRSGEIAATPIALPTLAEQRRIAGILDKADALRRKRKRSLELLDGLTQSVFLQAFGEACDNPNRFPACRLGDLCTFRGGSQPPKSTFSYQPGPDKVRLIQIRDYKTDAHATYIPKHLAKRSCSANDVMIGRYGPPLFQILKGLEGSYNVALMKAEPKPGVTRSFLFYLLSCPRLQLDVISQSERSAGQTGVNLKFLNSYPAYFPPTRLQDGFDDIVERHASLLEKLKRTLQSEEDLFSSLQHRAFSGQL